MVETGFIVFIGIALAALIGEVLYGWTRWRKKREP